jgi:hypothetical protein
MNVLPAHLAALCRLGYTNEEATFIYLVTTHAGYFTRPQFLRFTGQTKGGILHRFTTKLLVLGHVRATEYGRQMLVFDLYSRLVYGPIDKDDLRNRRRLSNQLVQTRLFILDFVLANLDSQYLETETAKVSYFHEKLRLPLAILPCRRYTGLNSTSHTDRDFVDRFPIFISRSLPPVPTFVYCDSDQPGLRAYLTHLRAYERLWRRLERFHFIYAAPTPKKFHGAEARFSQMFAPAQAIHTKGLARYFEVRLLWESHKTSSLTRADRDLLRDGDKRYQREPFESAYQKWASGGLSGAELERQLPLLRPAPQTTFETQTLPASYDIFRRELDRRPKTKGPLGGPLRGPVQVEPKCLWNKDSVMVRKPKADAAQAPKKGLVAGSDPILASRFSARIPSGFGGRSRPRYPQKFDSSEPVLRRFPC